MKKTIQKTSDCQAFTLVELLLGLILGAIIILIIGVISSISQSSYQKVASEANIYNDIAYGFKLFQNKVRSSENITKTPTSTITPILPGNVSCPWLSTADYEQLFFANKISAVTTTQRAFGICETGNVKYLIYVPDMNAGVKSAEIIFSAPNPGIDKFKLTLGSNQSVAIQISGKKDKVPFDMSTTIWRRLK